MYLQYHIKNEMEEILIKARPNYFVVKRAQKPVLGGRADKISMNIAALIKTSSMTLIHFPILHCNY